MHGGRRRTPRRGARAGPGDYDPAVSVAGKTAIVTGAATGIGAATARLLAERGARVVAAGLQPDALHATVGAIVAAGGEAVAVEADVADPAAIRAVAARAAEAFGGTDVLVNNAAVYPLGPWHEADAAQWDAVYATNVRGYFLMAQAVRPQMLARGGGAIVNLASVTFYRGEALLVSYVASKGAVIGFTRALAREAGPDGIRVNAVAPGAFPTAATAIHADQDALWTGVLENQSLKRRGEVEDVARAIAFFAGDDSGFVTGQTLLVDGGWMRG
jgi:NAD(P)-dependent dehydrogenase (short-subunit alcohol dehydrogenase family)